MLLFSWSTIFVLWRDLKKKLSQKKKKRRKLNRYLQKIIKEKKINSEKAKVLLVTEYMSEGKHTANFLHAFKKVGLSCDIATLSTISSSKNYKELPDFKDIKMYIGEPGGELYFWRIKALGVKKEKIFARYDPRYRYDVKQAREDSKKIIDYLKQIYDQEKEKIENNGK